MKDLAEAIEAYGFLPYFCNSLPGFSIEEHVDPKAWFTDDAGVWKWKGPVIRETGAAKKGREASAGQALKRLSPCDLVHVFVGDDGCYGEMPLKDRG